MKPLFCPLKREFFNQFKNGCKTTEYRIYGKRWNENTCQIGRKINLSLGCNGERLLATITNFEIKHIDDTHIDAQTLFKDKAEMIACISISLHI